MLRRLIKRSFEAVCVPEPAVTDDRPAHNKLVWKNIDIDIFKKYGYDIYRYFVAFWTSLAHNMGSSELPTNKKSVKIKKETTIRKTEENTLFFVLFNLIENFIKKYISGTNRIRLSSPKLGCLRLGPRTAGCNNWFSYFYTIKW